MIKISEVLDEFWRLYFAIIKGVFVVATTGAHLLITAGLFGMQRTFLISTRIRSWVECWTPGTPNIFVLHKRS